MSHGRADEAGPLLARDVKEASAGNGRAQSSVPTFMELRKYNFCVYSGVEHWMLNVYVTSSDIHVYKFALPPI